MDLKLITGDNIGMEENLIMELEQAINGIENLHNNGYALGPT